MAHYFTHAPFSSCAECRALAAHAPPPPFPFLRAIVAGDTGYPAPKAFFSFARNFSIWLQPISGGAAGALLLGLSTLEIVLALWHSAARGNVHLSVISLVLVSFATHLTGVVCFATGCAASTGWFLVIINLLVALLLMPIACTCARKLREQTYKY